MRKHGTFVVGRRTSWSFDERKSIAMADDLEAFLRQAARRRAATKTPFSGNTGRLRSPGEARAGGEAAAACHAARNRPRLRSRATAKEIRTPRRSAGQGSGHGRRPARSETARYVRSPDRRTAENDAPKRPQRPPHRLRATPARRPNWLHSCAHQAAFGRRSC